MPALKVKTLSAHLKGQNLKCLPQKSKPQVPALKLKPKFLTSKVKTLSAHLKGQNHVCLPQRSKPKVPALKVKSQTARLKGQKPNCPA